MEVTKDELIQLYNQFESSRKLASHLDWSQAKTIYWLNKYEVSYRFTRKRLDVDEGKVVRLYLKENKSAREIAELFDCSKQVINRILDSAEVPRRSHRSLTEEEESQVIGLYGDGLSSYEIGEQFSVTSATVLNILKRNGIARRKKTAKYAPWVTEEGYVLIYVPEGSFLDPMRNHQGRILEHRVVMANAMGRALRSDETVHHINGVKNDNKEGNLELRSGPHGQGIVLTCLDCGSHNIEPQAMANAGLLD